MNNSDLKRKYNITSTKALIHFINSLISLHKISRRKDDVSQISNTTKTNKQKNNLNIEKVSQKKQVSAPTEMTNSQSDFIDTNRLEAEIMLFEYINADLGEDKKPIDLPNQKT